MPDEEVFMEDRFERWLKVSIGMARFEPHLVDLVQDMGQLDAVLCSADAAFVRAHPEQMNALYDHDSIQSHKTQSYLWVLGAYEILRTLAQRVREGQSDDPQDVAERLKEARDRFARVRVPLAKFEAAGKHRATDYHVAYPGLDFKYGIAWQLNESQVISRQELSDVFLEALEFVRAAKLGRQAQP
ncbi:hypothetical protein [Pseudomonas syringae]|uniref:hypothetical protein n=1 Tax=Pseudomonas syringae TaxID=317 RepID=UPI00200B14B3|nr:hypothetical protein [Pseudomonas syringae]MCK9691862.1 hypothetical protein [Pseudomonas syringae pv. syringae]